MEKREELENIPIFTAPRQSSFCEWIWESGQKGQTLSPKNKKIWLKKLPAM